MAFGIDDVLLTAAAGISLTDTVVRTVKGYGKKGGPSDIESLIEEVRATTLQRIDEADSALVLLERTLVENGIGLNRTLQQVIESTPAWRPDQQHRLKRIRRSLNALADATYDATDDIAALTRCRDQTGAMGIAVADSAKAKHELNARLLAASSVQESVDILRSELLRHKQALV